MNLPSIVWGRGWGSTVRSAGSRPKFKSSYGYDTISNKHIEYARNVLIRPLTLLINQCIRYHSSHCKQVSHVFLEYKNYTSVPIPDNAMTHVTIKILNRISNTDCNINVTPDI